jgi:glycosyltransferase involved in cell wall biosynthesis
VPSVCVLTNSLFYPHLKGGEQISTWTLLQELKSLGWKVTVIARARPASPIVAVGSDSVETMLGSQHLDYSLSRGEFTEIDVDGIKIAHHFYSEDDLEEACVKYFSASGTPNYILGIDATAGSAYQSLSWDIARSLKIPAFVILRSTQWPDDDRFLRHPSVRFAANSPFTAEQFLKKYKYKIPIIYPFIKKENYLLQNFVPHHQEGFVTFMNPLRMKGAEIVMDLVEKNPSKNFYILPSGWGYPHTIETKANLLQFKRHKNVIIPAFRDDIRPIIFSTRLLLVPSLWEETFGRVVNEFQVNGVPVLATDSGNLPDTVGRGGVIIPRGLPLSEYNVAFNNILGDEKLYNALSQLAREHAHQEKFALRTQINNFVSWLTQPINYPEQITHP